MTPRFLILVSITLLLGQTIGRPAYTHWWEDPDVVDWSDAKVLEHLYDPQDEDRRYAGREMLRRWDQEALIAHPNTDEVLDILDCGAWPQGGALVEDYLLKGGGFTDAQVEVAVGLLSRRGAIPSGPRYTGRIGEGVRDEWFKQYIGRIPRSVFFAGTVGLMCKHKFLRDRLYRNDPWIIAWGAWPAKDGASWYIPWTLREYRAVVATICGDPVAEKDNQFIRVLALCVKTGNNEADQAIYATSKTEHDLLGTTVTIMGVGPISYAELIPIVLDRADWVDVIHKRLAVVESSTETPVMDKAGKVLRVVTSVTHQDRRSALIRLLADLRLGRDEAAKEGFITYWRREWRNYSEATWDKELLLRHPWSLSDTMLAWYKKESVYPFGDLDPEFLRGEWR